MPNNDFVSKEVLELYQKNVEDKLDRDENRLNNHSDAIDKLTNISGQLATIVDELRESNKKLVEDNQQIKLDLACMKQAQENAPKNIYWQTKWFEYVMKCLAIIAVILVLAAVGQGFAEKFLPTLQKFS